MHWYSYVAIVLLIGMFFALTAASKRARWSAKRIANGAMCIAIAFVLSMIKLFSMPEGGSVTPASMLPLVLFCLAAGPWQGLVLGCTFGLLQLLEDPFIVHPVQMLLDYPLAFGSVALSCIALKLPVNEKLRLPIAVLFAFVGRIVMATLSGVVFFSEYAGEQNVWAYSVIYNSTFLAPDCLFCILVSMIPGMDRIRKLL